MTKAPQSSPHTFHIPVMGTGFMVDAPLKVARYGVSSVISLVDDVLIEQMRRLISTRVGIPYEEIAGRDDDSRARRITCYLDLVDQLVSEQVESLRKSPFEPGSEITRYFELLPDSPLKHAYEKMCGEPDAQRRTQMQGQLRDRIAVGRIDVNIMSKGDRDNYRNGEKLAPEFSDALSALRGFANSTVRSSIVFSAGMNPRLYNYLSDFPCFFPDETGVPQKQIILKVSDYRSAEIQGRYLAKRGLWVSEFRVESGLNCGGHAFPTRGMLLGPILDEFRQRREGLYAALCDIYATALSKRGIGEFATPLLFRVTAQGGIGTYQEDTFLRQRYGVDSTGWGTPFLLVPEVTNVDQATLQKLCEATENDVYLSDSSPFGLPFWTLRTSASEDARRRRIAEDHPGSPCVRGYCKLYNTEFTTRPICTASREYQELKLRQLEHDNLTPEQMASIRQSVLNKSCICHDLAGGATLKNGIDMSATPAVCCGPNIADFSRVATLEEMVGHIYGRNSLLTNPKRPHMFVREAKLYVEYLCKELDKYAIGLSANNATYFQEYKANLLAGLTHYEEAAAGMPEAIRATLLQQLQDLRWQVESKTLAAAS